MLVLVTEIRQQKEIKVIQIRNKDFKSVAICREQCTMYYVENHKVSTQKLLGLINEFINVARYKINTGKSVAFL